MRIAFGVAQALFATARVRVGWVVPRCSKRGQTFTNEALITLLLQQPQSCITYLLLMSVSRAMSA